MNTHCITKYDYAYGLAKEITSPVVSPFLNYLISKVYRSRGIASIFYAHYKNELDGDGLLSQLL